jgi:hypothetical protein
MRRFTTFDVASGGSMVSACLAAALISGCAYPNQFRDVETSAPHALLTADDGDHWRDSGPSVFAIDSKPTSFWRTTERFRLPPGLTTLRVVADREPYDFAPLTFDAIAGRHYHLQYRGTRSLVALIDVTDHTKEAMIAASARDVEPSIEVSRKKGEQE